MSATSYCHSCGAVVVWAVTDAGKRMPVDPDPTVVGNLILERRDGQDRVTSAPPVATSEPKRWVSHFATCPQANAWRKPGVDRRG
jgi:hypothetical protein